MIISYSPSPSVNALDLPAPEVLARMPLAEAVLLVWRCVAAPERLQALWEDHRGRCYTKILSFATIVHLLAEALLHYQGSGRRSFEKNIQAQVLQTSVQAAFGKLRRLPLAVSEAFLEAGTATLLELYPAAQRRPLPASLQHLRLITLDGKAVKRVAKRLRKLRGL